MADPVDCVADRCSADPELGGKICFFQLMFREILQETNASYNFSLNDLNRAFILRFSINVFDRYKALLR